MTAGPPSLRCAECLYDLRGVTASCCPECGHPVALSLQGITNVSSRALRTIARGTTLLFIATITLVALFLISIILSALDVSSLTLLHYAAVFAIPIVFGILSGLGMWFFTAPLASTLRAPPPIVPLAARWVGVGHGLFHLAVATPLMADLAAPGAYRIHATIRLVALPLVGVFLFVGPIIFSAYARSLSKCLDLASVKSKATLSLVVSCSMPIALPIAAPALFIINLLLLRDFAKQLRGRAEILANATTESTLSPHGQAKR